jgi:predicted nucleotidyltransferase component of viral defense system
MHDAIRSMIERRRPQTQPDWDRALREVLQETALVGLWRTHFFDKAAFYGGTALRLFHGLDRFSGDLDFSLLEGDQKWKLTEKLEGLRDEIEAFGFSVDIESKNEGKIESAFIKANTRIHLIRIEAPRSISGFTASNRLVKVKLETDTDPPAGITTETKTLFEPFPVSIRIATLPCLFAGKLHACLCRSWKARVKGRDWYDLLFFVARGTIVDLPHLEARLRHSGHWTERRSPGFADIRRMLDEKIETIDWKQAIEDTLPFLRDPRSVESWNADLFREVAETVCRPTYL